MSSSTWITADGLRTGRRQRGRRSGSKLDRGDYIDLGVSENAPEALHLYESLCFEVWGREPDSTSYEGHRYDEIYMTLKL